MNLSHQDAGRYHVELYIHKEWAKNIPEKPKNKIKMETKLPQRFSRAITILFAPHECSLEIKVY